MSAPSSGCAAEAGAVEQKSETPELRRELGLLDATMINVGTILASGIFLVPAIIALQVPASGVNIGVWVVGGVLGLFGALTLAELSAALPQTGGLFVYLREAYSPLWGFLYGWTLFLVIQTGTIAAIAVGFGTYAGHFYPVGAWGAKLLAMAAILVLTAINYRGLKPGAWTQNLLTLAKLAIVGVILVWGFGSRAAGLENFRPLWPGEWPLAASKQLGLALIAVLWCYDGWVDVTLVAGEIKRPERNLPRSLVLSMLIITALYVALNLAYVAVLSLPGMAGRPLVAADFATRVLGPVGASFVAFLVMVSCLGATNGFVLTGPRVYYAMARARLFFASLARVHPGFHTPHYALLVQAVWSCLLVLSGTYEQLFTYVVFAGWVFYALAALAVIVLRCRQPVLPRPYRCWGYPVMPILFVVFAAGLIANTFISDLRDSLIGTVLVVSGVPAYWLFRRRRVAPEAEGGD